MLYRQMPTNIQLLWIKIFYREKQSKSFGDKVQFIKFHSADRWWNLEIFSLYFVPFFWQFQGNKISELPLILFKTRYISWDSAT